MTGETETGARKSDDGDAARAVRFMLLKAAVFILIPLIAAVIVAMVYV